MTDATVEQSGEVAQRKGREERRPNVAARRRKALTIIAAITGGVLLLVLGYLILTHGRQKTDDAQIDADVVALAPRVAGQVVLVSVVENQVVKRGEVVLQLDDRDYRARLALAAADLDTARSQGDAADAQVAIAEAQASGAFTQAKANLVGSNRSVSGAKAQLEQARANLLSRRAELRLAQVNLQRARDLRAADATPPQQVDQAQAQFDTAKAAVEAGEATIAAADEQLRRTVAQVNEAEGRVVVSRPVDANIAAARANAAAQHARIKSAEAALALANLNLEWTQVTAPGDGVVSRISSFPGAALQVGQPVAQFVPHRKYVTANFKETQIGQMRRGQPAEVKIDTYHRTLRGRVESLSGGTGARFSLFPPENATGNFVKVTQRVPVRISLEDVPEDIVLRAGQSVEVTVTLKE